MQLSTSKSALFLSSRGIATLVFQILAFPALCRRISHASILRFAIASRAVRALVLDFHVARVAFIAARARVQPCDPAHTVQVNFVQMKLSAVLRTRSVPGGLDAWDFASVLLLQALNGIGTCVCAAIEIDLTLAAPASHPATRSSSTPVDRVRSSARSTACCSPRTCPSAVVPADRRSCALMHTIAPIVAAEIYALSADRHVLDGNLYVVVGAGVGILSTLALISLRDTKAAWRDEPTHATESSDAA